MSMQIIFVGGVQFSYEILKSVLENGWSITAVFSYHESKQDFFSDIVSLDELTQKYNIPHIKIQNNINDPKYIKLFQDYEPDLILVMGWSQLLSDKIIQIPKYGVIGSHPTKLPKYRGRAPIPWTILKKLTHSALTFFYIEEGIDNGDILDQKEFVVEQNDDAEILYSKIIHLGKQMILENLPKIQQGTENRLKQDTSKFLEYWEKRKPEDGLINWNESAETIDRLIRASTTPYPGSFTFFKNSKLIIWKSEYKVNEENNPGEILEITDNYVKIGTKEGSVYIKKISFDNTIVPLTKIFHKKDLGIILGK